jgi:hypothetical protein
VQQTAVFFAGATITRAEGWLGDTLRIGAMANPELDTNSA